MRNPAGVCSFTLCLCVAISAFADGITVPELYNNPSLDVTVTTVRPLLSFFNAKGGSGERYYTIQLDVVPTFDSFRFLEYMDIPEEGTLVTSIRIPVGNDLVDGSRYYWRVMCRDMAGNSSPWASSRFFVDTASDDEFMGLVRVPVQSVRVSSGANPANIVDLDDPGQVTYWQSAPPGNVLKWVLFDLGERRNISRIWMLSNISGECGWLESFVWQTSDDGVIWREISGTRIHNNGTFRNIIEFDPVYASHLRLEIADWNGYAPQLNAVAFYSPGMPSIPQTPLTDYVLVVGNQMDGGTFTELPQYIESLGYKTIVVPHYEVSMDMLDSLARKPLAIVLSGNNADYRNLPMFEYNGEFEIIRESDIPILGICCGHQMLAMAYGYTFVNSMGWSDYSSMEPLGERTEIEITVDKPIFDGIPSPFTAPEIHGWSIALVPNVFEEIARSSYVQAISGTQRIIFGEQFHAEINVPDNQGTPFIGNFLDITGSDPPNLFNPELFGVGDEFLGLEIDFMSACMSGDSVFVGEVLFSGEIALSGTYRNEMLNAGSSFWPCFYPDPGSTLRLPRFPGDTGAARIAFTNSELASELLGGPETSIRATIVIDDYFAVSEHSTAMCSAALVEIRMED